MFGLDRIAIIGMLGALLVASAGSAWITRSIYVGKITAIELRHEQARNEAFQEGRDRERASNEITRKIENAYSDMSLTVNLQTETIVREIQTYVPDTTGCITVGLVRVLDAAALGTNPDLLDIAPDESNGTCTDLSSAALAESVVRNYGRARDNAERLTHLQIWVDEQLLIINDGAER